MDQELYDFMIQNSLQDYLEPLEHLERKDLDQLRYQMDLFVMPSSNDMFGLVTVEAMMSNVQVIASDTGANPEIIMDGQNGYLYHYGDAHQLVGLIEMLMENPIDRKRIMEKAYLDAMERFSVKVCAENMIEIYKELLNV